MKPENFRKTINGKETYLFTLRNNADNEISITNYGGAIVSIMVPDKNGNKANIIQGHDNIDDVINSPEPFLSTLIGRYGNRIAKGKFILNDKEYYLAVNNGPNHLHGGPTGFHARVWDAEQINPQTLVLRYVSAYYECNKKTIVNMTHHGFFSLAGIANPTPTIEDVICTINADYYLPIDETSIPTGEIRKVEGTPFDFREPHAVGLYIDSDNEQIKNGAGYDHCFVLNKHEPGELTLYGSLYNRTRNTVLL